jgi:D-alanine-D-alanine ligase
MIIGITYDLRQDYLAEGYGEEETAEFDRAGTIDAIEHTLLDLGYQVERIGHIRKLIQCLAAGKRWDLVFNIAEGLRGFGREAQVPALLDAYDIPYTFSDPMVLSLTLHKGMTKHILRDLGLPTPDFFVAETESDLEKMPLPYPVFAKPVAEGTSKGISPTSKIHSLAELFLVGRKLLRDYKQPVLIERFLPGREFTVGIVGTGDRARVLGVMEVVLKAHAENEVYTYINKENCEELVEYHLAEDAVALRAAELALSAWRGLGCRDAGRVDLRADEAGYPNLMEINPLAGMHPEHSDLPILCSLSGIHYRRLIEMILESVWQRVENQKEVSSGK